jgi:hypothetical protein
MTSSNWSPISLGCDGAGPDPVAAISRWSGLSQPGGSVRLAAGFALLGPVVFEPAPREADGGALQAMRRATACLQLIPTGQVQAASMSTIRSDVDLVTPTETEYGDRSPPWTSPDRLVRSLDH